MLTSINVKFIFDSACLAASLGDKGLVSSAKNILQIADVVCWVVFLLKSCYVFSQQFAYFFSWNERNDLQFWIHYQNNPTSSPGLLDWSLNNLAILLHDWCHLFTYHKIFPNLVNSSWLWWIMLGILADQKYFEWIIIITIVWGWLWSEEVCRLGKVLLAEVK